MLEMSKDCLAMGTNYERRLGGTEKFLTTTTTGKRIEVKSDILTTIYNNKIMETNKNVQLVNPQEFGLEAEKANEMVSNLKSTIAEREVLQNAYIDVIDLEVTKENIPTFKELRLKLVKNRTTIEKWHKSNKAFFLAGGRYVDAIRNKEILVNQEMESKLMDAEKHFENLERERLTQLQNKRVEQLSKYVEDANERDLSSMEDDVWEAYLSAKKKAYEDRIEAERKAEAERLENEILDKIAQDRRFEIAPYAQFNEGNHDLRSMTNEDYSNLLKYLKDAKNLYEAEQEKIRLENERLKKEAEAKELEAKKERQRIENERAAEAKKQAEILAKQKAEAERLAKLEAEKAEKLRKEQEAILIKERQDRAKLEADLKSKRNAEIEAENKRIEAEKLAKLEAEKLAKAPDKEKLKIWIESMTIKPIGAEKMNKESIILANEVFSKFESFKRWAKKEVESL